MPNKVEKSIFLMIANTKANITKEANVAYESLAMSQEELDKYANSPDHDDEVIGTVAELLARVDKDVEAFLALTQKANEATSEEDLIALSKSLNIKRRAIGNSLRTAYETMKENIGVEEDEDEECPHCSNGEESFGPFHAFDLSGRPANVPPEVAAILTSIFGRGII